jgi:hypothetical protein
MARTRRQATSNADNQEQRRLLIVKEVARGFLRFPVALLDLAQDGEAIACALTRIRCSQGVFTVPTLVDAVIVRRPCDLRRGRESGSTRCQMQKSTARKFHGVPSLNCWQRDRLFRFNVCRFDNRPPFLDLGFLKRAKRFGRR